MSHPSALPRPGEENILKLVSTSFLPTQQNLLPRFRFHHLGGGGGEGGSGLGVQEKRERGREEAGLSVGNLGLTEQEALPGLNLPPVK